MELSRRRFFGLLGGVAAAQIAAPVIRVFAPAGGWHQGELGIWQADKFKSAYIPFNESAFEVIELGIAYWNIPLHIGSCQGISRSSWPIRIPTRCN